ncbi:MAG: DUF4127 family protein [Bacillota bacterium]|nr:DUF4127 family protein [Bacillota bacterium]
MKKGKPKFLIVVLCVIITALFPTGYKAEDGLPTNTIAYIPLDNRPVNTERVEYLANSIGHDLLMPDEDLYATKLDGQPLNSNGTQYGDPQALCAWLREIEEKGCNYYIISLDQVLSGGLVNSRSAIFATPESEPAPEEPPVGDDSEENNNNIPNNEEPEEEEVQKPAWEEIVKSQPENEYIQVLAELAADPNNKIVFFDTVMRLASTVGYNGYGQDMYDALREYGKVDRKELGSEELTVENIIDAYGVNALGYPCEEHLASDANDAKKQLLTDNDKEAINNYLSSRTRKLLLIDAVTKNVKHSGNVYYMVGVDDSSPGNSVQTNEIEYIKQIIGDDGLIFDGADELGMMALTHLYKKIQNNTPTISVSYFGGRENAEGDYETEELSTVIEKHLDAAGAIKVSNSQNADIQALVLTPPRQSSLRYFYADDLLKVYRKNIENHVPTIIIDVSGSSYYNSFNQRLLNENNIGYLLGYSSWNTWGNAAGIALSQGICRYLYLMGDDQKTEAAHIGFIRSMTFGFVKDMAYVYEGRSSMAAYITELGLNSANFYSQENLENKNINKINRQLRRTIEENSQDILANLNNSNIILDLKEYKEAGIQDVSMNNYYFPWYRSFECTFTVNVGGLGAPHTPATEPEEELIYHEPYINGYEDKTFRPEAKVTRGETAKMIATAKSLELRSFQGMFPDVEANSWYCPAVESAAEKGYLTGYEDGSFRPLANMTRAEFAAFLIKYYQAENKTIPAAGSTARFTDVSSDKWYYSSIDQAAALGLINGYEDGSFRPENQVTRCEAVTMFNRLLGRNLEQEKVSLNLMLGKNPFSDISQNHWGYKEVLEAAVKHSFIAPGN